MAFLKFNKSELVNLSYSLKREIIFANRTGAYCNTSIVTCNTRRYHGLFAVPVDAFGGQKHMLLSSVDESLVVNGKQFNLGIHCYGDIYEPRGHKYVVDFQADPVVSITYKVGGIVFRKSILLAPDVDQTLVKYELIEAPAPVTLIVKPFLAFRNIHSLTHRNQNANLGFRPVAGGAAFRMYPQFPELFIQSNTPAVEFKSHPDWYMNVTYSDEYRRGFDCREDLMVPGSFALGMKKGDSAVFSAATSEMAPATLKRKFNSYAAKAPRIVDFKDQLVRCADSLVVKNGDSMRINAGLSWMKTGLLRETLCALPGLTLYAGKADEFEKILDTLIADEKERLFHRTTQVEAPLCLAIALQQYIAFGADPKKVWNKYSQTVKEMIESYLPENLSETEGLTYIEPFVGGGAVLFWILQKYPNIQSAVINDINKELICTYRVIQGEVEQLISKSLGVFKHFNGFDPRYVSHALYLPQIARILNPYNYTKFFENKALLGYLKSNEKLYFPKCYLRVIDGQLYDNDMRQIGIETALAILRDAGTFIIKPAKDSAGGNSVRKINVNDYSSDPDVKDLLSSYGDDYCAQELVNQCDFMAHFNPSSVNTLRITTLYLNSIVSLCNTVLRYGQTGSNVDNWGAGGVLVGVDDDGRLRENGYLLDCTPISEFNGIKLSTQVIPNYTNIIGTILSSHVELFPLCRLIGWDVTIDEKGRIAVLEINSSQPGIFGEQLCNGPIFGERTDEVMSFVRSHSFEYSGYKFSY
ncbi:MAG: glycogen debranching enzyme N-terminal domain-containing protein, partial [Bacteroidaceae bacterium]|nr:glycogen debranching enzyme N-terminal domain-containing protein [Bacteroidaceae bacterium]